jgi:hypothetical protein
MAKDEKIYNINSLEIPETVNRISLRKCLIRKIPKDFFIKFTQLETIDLYANSIESFDFDFPDTVTTIDLSYNKVRSVVVHDIKNLEYVNLSFNFMDYFPTNLENIRYDIDHNNIPEKLLRKQDINRAYNQAFPLRFDNGKLQEQPPFQWVHVENNNDNNGAIGINTGFRPGALLVQDFVRLPDNVHETHIQASTRKSIKYLMEESFNIYPKEENYFDDILRYRLKKKHGRWSFIAYALDFLSSSKRTLKYYNSFENRIVYDYTDNKYVTTSQILERIWAHAKNSELKDSIMENLFIQMDDGYNFCFVGKYTRLINTLSSFVDKVEAEIPIKTQISNKIVSLKAKNSPNDVIFNEMKIFMDELEIPKDEQEPWLEAIKELN